MKAGIISLALLFVCSFASAQLNTKYGDLEINGQKISFPIGNNERQHEYYFLKLATEGDKAALKVFLGGEKEKWFYIGEYDALWLVVYEDGRMELKKP